jgi:transposase
MARHLGLRKVHPQRGWDALRRLGWSLQSPRPRHPRAATPAQKAALKKTRAAKLAGAAR